MSGGGSDNKKPSTATPAPVAKPNYPNAPTQQTVQPFAPGMQEMLASQLGNGFGQGGLLGQQDFMGLLNSIYSPMKQTNYKEPMSVTQEAIKTGNFNPVATGDLTLDNLLNGKAVGTPAPVPVVPGTPGATPAKVENAVEAFKKKAKEWSLINRTAEKN